MKEGTEPVAILPLPKQRGRELFMKTVEPIRARGDSWSLLQLFGLGPKWTVTCGNCGKTFQERLPVIDRPGVSCPSCGVVNVIPVVVDYD